MTKAKIITTSIALLILIFSILIPISSQAITQNQIAATVQIVCPDNYGNLFSGSGTIIDTKGIILTNRHVVTDKYGGIIKTCFVGFVESIGREPNFGTKSHPNLAEVKHYTTSDDMDAAILYLENPTNKSYSYVNIWNSNSNTLQFGDKIEIVGFPSIGGSTITYTSGDFSGFGSRSSGTQNYLKSTAPVEHGNSGGAAYNLKGQSMGIPTFVVRGELNSISYVLSINSIQQWLSAILGYDYADKIKEYDPIIEDKSLTIQRDITPPSTEGVGIFSYLDQNLTKSAESVLYNTVDKPYFKWEHSLDQSLNIMGWKNFSDESGIVGYYVYFGENIRDPVVYGSFIKESVYKAFAEKSGNYFIVVKAKDGAGNISEPIIYNYPFWKDNPSAPKLPYPSGERVRIDRDFTCYANSKKTEEIKQCWGHLLYDGIVIEWKKDPSVIRYYYDFVELGTSRFPPTEDGWGSKFTAENSLKFLNVGNPNYQRDYALWIQAEDANNNLSKPIYEHFCFGNYLDEKKPIQKFIDDAKDENVNLKPDGTLVKTASWGGVYLIENRNKRSIKSAKIFLAKGYKWEDVVVVSQEEMNSYPLGTDLTIDEKDKDEEPSIQEEQPSGTLTEGMLVRAKNSNGVYLMHDNQKRPIKSAEIFLGRGYKWGDVVEVDQSALDIYPLGEDVTSSETITTENDEQMITINVPRLRVRSLPSLEGKIIISVSEGQEYSILAEQDGWYQINYETSKTGWIMAEYTI